MKRDKFQGTKLTEVIKYIKGWVVMELSGRRGSPSASNLSLLMTLRDGTGREEGGGSGWGTHVHPWLIQVNVWQTPLQYCKVISLQLK